MEYPAQMDGNMNFDPLNMTSFALLPSATAPMSPDQHTYMDNYSNMSMGTNASPAANQSGVPIGQRGFQCDVCFKVKSTKSELT